MHENKVTEREWRKLVGMYNAIEDFDPLAVTNKERIHRSIVEGVPEHLRGDIWCILCHCKQEKNAHSEGLYRKLIEMDNPEEERRITKDVTRTFSNYPNISVENPDSESASASWST